MDNDQQIDENKAINLDLGIYHNLPICYFWMIFMPRQYAGNRKRNSTIFANKHDSWILTHGLMFL